jgi:hypothetical protein
MASVMPPSPTDAVIAARKVAELDFELAKVDASERLKFQSDFAQAAWRLLTLVNGGAIVALFTFIGNAKPAIDHGLIWSSFVCFCAGLAFCALSIGAGFFAQAYYMKSNISVAWNKQAEMHGYAPAYTDVQKSEERTGEIAEYVGIGCAALSLISFIAGAACALSGVTV